MFVEYYKGDVSFWRCAPYYEPELYDGYCGATTYVFAPDAHNVKAMFACNSSVMIVPTLTFEGEI